MSVQGLGRVKTKSDLVVMSSGRQIFAFLCSPHDRRAQNSGCDYTPQSFTQPGSVTEVVQIHSNVRLGLPPEANIVLAGNVRFVPIAEVAISTAHLTGSQ